MFWDVTAEGQLVDVLFVFDFGWLYLFIDLLFSLLGLVELLGVSNKKGGNQLVNKTDL